MARGSLDLEMENINHSPTGGHGHHDDLDASFVDVHLDHHSEPSRKQVHGMVKGWQKERVCNSLKKTSALVCVLAFLVLALSAAVLTVAAIWMTKADHHNQQAASTAKAIPSLVSMTNDTAASSNTTATKTMTSTMYITLDEPETTIPITAARAPI